ncbi:response regulator transcription factor [Pseudothauera nasutitermitis]|uniref:Response regulator transcription factor n=1 Tax=Pseudothauera nasutitermitis TaxID=2565930 RepID=A0A4S4B1X2_9RHOO|nr:response regulator transcription factor [Pseudothauera nasutitermitis]THF66581.1 response regulator transcription factor [Pseudothauera nasutitermitis]
MPNQPIRILVVDDHQDIRDPLAAYLGRYGLQACTAGDAASARALLAQQHFDLAIVDVMLPGEDGLSLCRSMYEHMKVPVILLSAMTEPVDRIAGLEVGADDYVTKPFDPRELIARIKTILRRLRTTDGGAEPPSAGEPRYYYFDVWMLDLNRRELAHREGYTVELSAVEFRLLRALAEHPNMVLSRERLLNLTHRNDSTPFDRNIDTQMSRLRKKLGEKGRNARLLRTAWGDGYMLSAEVRRMPA